MANEPRGLPRNKEPDGDASRGFINVFLVKSHPQAPCLSPTLNGRVVLNTFHIHAILENIV